MRTIAVCLLCYGFFAQVVFGDIVQPIFLMTIGVGRLGLIGWPLLVVGSFIASLAVFLLPVWVEEGVCVRPPLYVLAALSLSVATVGTWAEVSRRDAVEAFSPDEVFQNSILRSLRHAPSELQIFLHAGAVKDCVPYAWSYHTMSMYRLPPDAARNVLPRQWLNACQPAKRR